MPPEARISRRALSARVSSSGLGALAVLSAGHLIVDAYSSSYAPILAILRDRFDLSFAQVGGGAAIFAFSASVMQPLYGVLSDRLRSSLVLAAAPGIAAAGIAAVSLAGAYPLMLLCLFVAGIGVAAYHPQGASQAADTMPQRPSVAMAMFIGAGNVGFAMGPALVTVAYGLWGWDGLWRLGIPGIVATMLLIPMAPATPGTDRQRRGRVREALAARWKPLSRMYAFVVVRGTVQLIFVGFLPLYLLDAGMSVAATGTALSAFLAAGSIGSVAGGLLGDRFGERSIIRLSMAASLPLFLCAFLMTSMVARVAILSAAFFVLLLSNALTVVLAQSWVPDHRSTVSSLLMGFAWGMGGLLAPLFGMVADVTGLGPALAVVGGLPLVGAGLAWLLPERDAGAPFGDE